MRLHRPSSNLVLLVCSFALFAAIGGVLTFHYGSIMGDAESRVADGWYVFFSRDPHLAAVGFVWNPLPSILVMPFFLFKSLWPALTNRAFAGNLASALFMAGCVVELRRILRELGTSQVVAWVLLAVFALNPMILFYGANGMTEAFYLFFLLVALRYLMRWLHAGGMINLVIVGIALGLDYLVRYEAIAAAGVVGLVVGYVTFRRTSGTVKERLQTAGADLVVYGLPPAAAFVGWAIVSYVITGQLFQQISSQYGNTSQIQVLGVQHTHYAEPVVAMICVLAWCPLLPLPAIAAWIAARRRRDARLAALSVLAGTAGFSLFAMLTGQAVANLRFFMPLLPLWLICLGYVSVRDPASRGPDSSTWSRRISVAFVALALGTTRAPSSSSSTGSSADEPTIRRLSRRSSTCQVSPSSRERSTVFICGPVRSSRTRSPAVFHSS
jgi:4-amino-4-deoxy-L-arabinose transferase-like glycosyltransferase